MANCDWAKFYQVINDCNEVIKFAPEVQGIDNTFSDYIMYGFLSEAYFLRSLSYFYLVRIFRDVPYITEPTETDGYQFLCCQKRMAMKYWPILRKTWKPTGFMQPLMVILL